MNPLVNTTLQQFKTHYGYPAEYYTQAPGRVNLIGEHTDYNDGFVLPCAINYGTIVACKKRQDNIVRLHAVNFGEDDQFSLQDEITSNKNKQWSNYVRGVFKYMLQDYPQVTGCDLLISGNIPLGSGLSSSAALEVSVATALKTLYELPIHAKTLALSCQKAENAFVGCNCGIMDQFISTMGEKNHALLIDCRSLETQSIPIPQDMNLLIINSNVPHGLVDSEYNLRRQQCEEASRILGVAKLRDADLSLLEQNRPHMTNTVYRRARHIITENNRTLQAAKALAANDMQTMARLMQESHESMRYDFEITVPEINYLVEIIQQETNSCVGVRMTGGGFGGCVIALASHEQIEPIRQAVAKAYQAKTSLKESFHICHASQGASSQKI